MKSLRRSRSFIDAPTSAADHEIWQQHVMLSVYSYLSAGLTLSGAVAYLASKLGLHVFLAGMPVLFWTAALAPIPLGLMSSARAPRMSAGAAHLAFWSYAALLGLSLSTLFAHFLGEGIALPFFVAAAMFLAMILHACASRCDLTSYESLLGMGTAGIVIASVVAIVLASSPVQLGLSLLGVVLVVCLMAYCSRRIHGLPSRLNARSAVVPALILYAGFINVPPVMRFYDCRKSIS